jgi:hypothetical protein
MSKITETEILYKNIAKAAIRELRKEEKEKQKKEVLHNTELLLNRYFDIKEAMGLARCRFKVADEEIWLKSIFRNKAISKFLINHFETCMDVLEEKYAGKARILRLMYMDLGYRGLSWQERILSISEQSEHLLGVIASERTVAKWRADMVRELSLLLFCADGLKLYTL